MATGTPPDADVEKVKRRQAKAEHAAGALEASQARSARTAKEHEDAAAALADEKSALKAAAKQVTKLTEQVEARKKLVKTLDKERKAAAKEVSRQQDDAEKHLQKLTAAQAAVTAEVAVGELADGNAKAAVRTVKATSSRTAANKQTPAKKASAKRAPAAKR